jgi:hypothetical protein
MMQAALYNQEPVELPAGGIATFLTAETGAWADDDDYPTTGIGSIPDVADKLAEFGRYEDTYMVHAAEGETVIPMEVFDKNPALKESLFAQMREMGIEPEEYIVGSELNSLNPVTGQPEFFLKKLFRGLKKAVKKAFKVVAPIVVQALLTPILGPIGASAATGFLQAKVSGASTKDALKGAGIAALTTGIVKGAQGFASAGKGATFGERMAAAGQGVKSGFTGRSTFTGDPSAQRPNELAKLMGVEDMGATMGGGTGYFQAGTPAASIADAITGGPESAPALTDPSSGQEFTTKPSSPVSSADPASASMVADAEAGGSLSRMKESIAMSDPAKQPTTIFEPSTVATDTLDKLQAGTQSASGDPSTISERFMEIFKDNPNVEGGALREAVGDVASFALPAKEGSLFNRYAVPVGLALAADAAMTPDVEEGGVPADFDTRLGIDVFSSDPMRYGYGYNTYGGFRPAGMADGGSFPPRDGAIAGPGTGTSDDIPAMLSDGEFVMTARAVRGAGNGSRKQGMRRMYDMMRNFESAA